MQKHDIITDELNKITNRCIGKLLESLGENISPIIKREIKHHLRWYQNNVRDVIINVYEGQINDSRITTK
jgi:hypothetical protein